MIYLLFFEAILLIFQVVSYRLYKSSIAILFAFIINTFVSPTIYYDLLNGESYVSFTESDFNIYIIVGCVYIATVLFLNFLVYNLKLYKFVLSTYNVKVKSNRLVRFFSISIILLCLGYVVIFRDRLPLLELLLNNNLMGSLERPDVSGSIPFYFSISIIMTVFFPMYYFFYKERMIDKGFINTSVWYVIIIFALTVGGSKGTVVYFFLFIWIYIWKFKVDYRIVLAFFFVLYIYELIMNDLLYFYSGQLMDGLEAPFRRFFVTQGAMFINRIPIIENAIHFSDDNISSVVYTRVYGALGGSAPTYFVGDLIVHYGYVIGMLLGAVITFIIMVIGKKIDSNRVGNLYKYWGMFYILYSLGNSAIDSLNFCIRLCIVFLLIKMLSIAETKMNVE